MKLETEPPRYLNAVYLAVMFVQNGSAVLVAIIAEQYFGHLGITLASIGFTITYFVVVEAMSKTFAHPAQRQRRAGALPRSSAFSVAC